MKTTITEKTVMVPAIEYVVNLQMTMRQASLLRLFLGSVRFSDFRNAVVERRPEEATKLTLSDDDVCDDVFASLGCHVR